MTKKRLIISFLGMVLSLFTFIVATYAWFAISEQTNSGPVTLSVDPGIIKEYEIYYYNADNVYKYNKTAQQLNVWNGSSFVTPTYTNIDDVGYEYSGLFVKEYDTLIPSNNIDNSLIMQITLGYEVPIDLNISVKALVDTNIYSSSTIEESIAWNAIENFSYPSTPSTDPSTYNFFSQIIYIQSMHDVLGSGSDYLIGTNYSEGTNLYDTIEAIFITDENDGIKTYNSTYPLNAFYSDFDSDPPTPDYTATHVDEISFDSITLYSATTGPQSSGGYNQINLFFCFSYFKTPILQILGTSTGIENVPLVRFFPDVYFEVRREVS